YFQDPQHAPVYHHPTATAYATGVLNSLPGPAGLPVSKLGVAANGLNLTYIPAGWRNNQDLLQRPCGDPGANLDQAGYNTGRTSYAQLQAGFPNLFANDAQLNAIPQPLFAIVDTDSAHHFSAPLV